MDNTIIQQGTFISEGTAVELDIRSDVDWMEVINDTQFANTATPGRGVKFEWQRGLAPGEAWVYSKLDAVDTLAATKALSNGFTLVPGAPTPVISGTTITKANPPVCTAANHGLSNGDFVLFQQLTNMPQIALVAFTIANVTTNTFELIFFNTNTANFVAETSFVAIKGSAGTWFGQFDNITSVITGTTTQIQEAGFDEEVNYPIGTVLRFNVPKAYGMVELDRLQGVVLAHDTVTNTYTVDIDSTGFTPFAWPDAAAFPQSLPTVEVVGSVANNSLAATDNLDNIGMELGAGTLGPAGSIGDRIFWKAGKSFSNLIA